MNTKPNEPRHKQIERAPLHRAINGRARIGEAGDHSLEQCGEAELEGDRAKHEQFTPPLLPALRTRFWVFGIECSMF